MSSLEFERLKNKVEVAKATIVQQNKLIGELKAQLASIPAPAPVEITDADYAAISKGLDDVFSTVEVLKPIEPEPTILPQADPVHPNLQG